MSPLPEPWFVTLTDRLIRSLAALNAGLYQAHDVNDVVETRCVVEGPETLQALRSALVGIKTVPLHVRFEIPKNDPETLYVSTQGAHKDTLRLELLRLHVEALARRYDDPVLQTTAATLCDRTVDPFMILGEALAAQASMRASLLEHMVNTHSRNLEPMRIVLPNEEKLNEELRSLRERVANLESAIGPKR